MSKSIKYLIISVVLLCILTPSYFCIQYQMLPIYKIEYKDELINGMSSSLMYANLKNHSYKIVMNDEGDYSLGKWIGKTGNGLEIVFAVKGHKDLIAVTGLMIPPTYFKEIKDSD